jgi:hypothetical protein
VCRQKNYCVAKNVLMSLIYQILSSDLYEVEDLADLKLVKPYLMAKI